MKSTKAQPAQTVGRQKFSMQGALNGLAHDVTRRPASCAANIEPITRKKKGGHAMIAKPLNKYRSRNYLYGSKMAQSPQLSIAAPDEWKACLRELAWKNRQSLSSFVRSTLEKAHPELAELRKG